MCAFNEIYAFTDLDWKINPIDSCEVTSLNHWPSDDSSFEKTVSCWKFSVKNDKDHTNFP